MDMRKIEKLGLGLGLVLAAVLVTSAASAWSSMRCGSKLVSLGDPMYAVRAICGEPDHVESYVEYRTERYRVRTSCQKGKSGQDVCSDVIGERTVEVPIHRLTYDFGRNRFISYLRFEFQSLVLVESGSYGVKN
jgi:hypothetical protein